MEEQQPYYRIEVSAEDQAKTPGSPLNAIQMVKILILG